jgi:putative DNA primase/helicase
LPINLNDAPEQQPLAAVAHHDLDDIAYALGAIADRLMPALLPEGRYGDDRKTWRVANIKGGRPRKQGSCVIQLAGKNAGSWVDWDNPTVLKGGPISTIKEALSLSDRETIPECLRIIEEHGGGSYLRRRVSAPVAPKRDSSANISEANYTFDRGDPLAGTLAERYLTSRGIKYLPSTDDVRFNDSTTNWETKRAEPALILRFRRPDGTPTGGIQRIYLKSDGSGRIGKKMMLGPADGVVMLASPNDTDGTLGIGEGIESTLSAMILFNAAGWAAGSAGGMVSLGEWLREHPETITALGIRRVLVWADKGDTGEKAANALAAAVRDLGVPAVVCRPKGDDDFNDDLIKGLAPDPVDDCSAPPGLPALAPPAIENDGAQPQQQPEQEIIPPQSAELFAEARTLTRDYQPTQVSRLLQRTIKAGLDKIDEQQIFDTIRKGTGISAPEFKKIIRGVRREVAPAGTPSWTGRLALNFFDEPLNTASNVLIALRCDDGWRDVLGFDEFSQRPMIMRRPPWVDPDDDQVAYPRPLADVDEARTLIWVQERGIHARADAVRHALAVAVDDNRYHPVRDYLELLKWDGQPRLNNWLTYYLGVEPIPNYTDAIGVCWMISAVARIFEPGCIAKYCLILEGDQDLKKSTALRILGDPWFTDHISELGTKDSVMEAGNAWIVELAELDSARKAHNSAIKAFISRQVDKFRPPFGHHVIEQPRQCVLAGTINPVEGIFTDATGAVRFWPVACTSIDADALRHDRDQLWAEAVHRYRLGEKWHLDNEDQLAAAQEQQELRYAADSWEANIEKWIVLNASWLTRFTVTDILKSVFEKEAKDHDRASQTRVGIAMKRIGKRTGWRQDVKSSERPRPYVKVSD